MRLLVECVSTQPRVFVTENFLSEAEADAIIRLARPKVGPYHIMLCRVMLCRLICLWGLVQVTASTVGTADSGGVLSSNTRTSRNTWIARDASPITETITRRVADMLGERFGCCAVEDCSDQCGSSQD